MNGVELTGVSILDRLELVVVPRRAVVLPIGVGIRAGIEQSLANTARPVVLRRAETVDDVVVVDARRLGIRVAARRADMIIRLLLQLFVRRLLLQAAPLVILPAVTNVVDSRHSQHAVGWDLDVIGT